MESEQGCSHEHPYFLLARGQRNLILFLEDKQIIDSIKAEMEAYASECLEKVLKEKFDIIKDKKPDIKVEELTDSERDAFVKASLSVRNKISDLAGAEGREIMDLVIQDVEKYEKEIDTK